MNICVFSSVLDVDEKYTRAGEEFARLMAAHKHDVVCGASNRGMMKRVIDIALKEGSKVTGIIAEALIAQKAEGYEIIVEKDLAARKAGFLKYSDAFAILPGGFGTLDEATEIMELKKHRLHDKPIVFLNIDTSYSGIKEQLEQMNAEGFLQRPVSEMAVFATTPQEALEYIEKYGN